MLRVLVVDDEPLIQRALARLLSEHHRVIPCLGPGALEICEREKPDVALVDVHLSDIDGLELADQLQAMAPTMRVIVTTGALLDEDSVCFPVLLKPFTLRELLDAIGDTETNGDDDAPTNRT